MGDIIVLVLEEAKGYSEVWGCVRGKDVTQRDVEWSAA